MCERKHILYFMGSLDGDIRLFRQIWVFIKDYLTEGNATIFVSGNFGLQDPAFTRAVAKETKGLVSIHIAGGNAAKEGWERIPPPNRGVKEIAHKIYLHAFGSSVALGTKRILFLGRGEAFKEDYLPNLSHKEFCAKPDIHEYMIAMSYIEHNNPDIVVAHSLPSSIAAQFLANYKDDVRTKRLQDCILPAIDAIQNVYEQKVSKDRFWFAGSLGIKGSYISRANVHYISLCPFIMVHGSLASLEYVETTTASGIEYALKNLAYV